MKRLILAILLLVLPVAPAMGADWSAPVLTACDGQPYAWGGGGYMFCYELACTSNADSSGDHVLSDMMDTAFGTSATKKMRQLQGTMLYWIDYVPATGATTPTSEATITIDKETTALIFSEAVTTAATAQSWRGDVDTNSLVPITDITIAITTLANTKTATIKLWFFGGNK